MKYVVYEVWTRSKIVEAADLDEAHDKGQPEPRPDLILSNWHVVPIAVDLARMPDRTVVQARGPARMSDWPGGASGG